MNWFKSLFSSKRSEEEESRETIARVRAAVAASHGPKQPLFTKESPDRTLVAIIDLESTGLEETDEPVSVGALLLEIETKSGDLVREVDSYYGIREPLAAMNPEAHALHALSPEQLRGRYVDVDRLSRIVNSAELLIAHNAKFNRRMLACILPYVMNAKWACTVYTLKFDWAKISKGGNSLDAICRALKVPRAHPHHSLSDCRSLQSVLLARGGKTARSKRLMARVISHPWAPPP